MFVGIYFCDLKTVATREFRHINPSQTLMNLQQYCNNYHNFGNMLNGQLNRMSGFHPSIYMDVT